MKKLFILFFGCLVGSLTAQNIKTYSGNINVSVGCRDLTLFRIGDCKETYSYYVGEDGSYVKSGSYSLVGNRTVTDDVYNGTGKVVVTYSVNATFKDGLLNGHLTAKVSSKGYLVRWINDRTDYDHEQSLSASFKDGVPDGQWEYSEKIWDKNIRKSHFFFNEGKLVGDYDFYLATLSLAGKGKFDPEGNLLSATLEGIYPLNTDLGSAEFNLDGHNNIISYYKRYKDNTSREHYKADEELLREYGTGEHSIDSMIAKGYFLSVTERADGYSKGYCLININGPYSGLNFEKYITTIIQNLFLDKYVGGIKSASYPKLGDYCLTKIKKTFVKPLSGADFNTLLLQTSKDSLDLFKDNNPYSDYEKQGNDLIEVGMLDDYDSFLKLKKDEIERIQQKIFDNWMDDKGIYLQQNVAFIKNKNENDTVQFLLVHDKN